jgi:signal transduction histidine kinase
MESEAISLGEMGADENPERKQQLMTLCSFDVELLEQLLGNLGRAIVQSTDMPAPEAEDSASAARDWVMKWQQQMAAIPMDAIDLRSLNYLLMKQIQKQEEIWHRHALYRRQAELTETLQIQNEELQNAVRLKDEFLNNVGQELRTPLTTIKTALTLLNSPSIKPPQRQRYMDLIAKECDRQSSLITSLLDLVQLDRMAEQTTLQAVRLADVVPGVVSTYQPLAEEKGVMLAYTVPENLPQVACVDAWLKQIVINLLHNGIKFTPRGGQVWVRAKQQGEYVQLEFRDTGIGIPQSEVPKIFDRFYRGRQSNEDVSGAGLGLTIVQQLLLHCSGSISVKSKLGEGSTFNVLLPIYKTPTESSI